MYERRVPSFIDGGAEPDLDSSGDAAEGGANAGGGSFVIVAGQNTLGGGV